MNIVELENLMAQKRFSNNNKELPASFFEDGDAHLLELYDKVWNNRATGRSTRIANDIIDKFFSEPMGTLILVEDHYYDYKDQMGHNRANKILLELIMRRLEVESPQIKFETVVKNGACALIRKTPTAREMLVAEYEKELKRKLNEVNKNESSWNK